MLNGDAPAPPELIKFASADAVLEDPSDLANNASPADAALEDEPPAPPELMKHASAPASVVNDVPYGLELIPAAPLPGYPQVFVGTKVDAAAALCEGNPLRIGAIVNCARDDWLDQVHRGKCGAAAQAAHGALKKEIEALVADPVGGVACGDVRGIAFCTFNARDRDRIDPIIIGNEVAVPGLAAYDASQHFPGALGFIREQRALGRRLLIHCLRGENRSGSIAVAFLVVDGCQSVEEAVESVQRVRGYAALSNRAFVEQVAEFAAKSEGA